MVLKPRRLSSLIYRAIFQFMIVEKAALVFCMKVHGIELVKSLIVTLAAALALYQGKSRFDSDYYYFGIFYKEQLLSKSLIANQ